MLKEEIKILSILALVFLFSGCGTDDEVFDEFTEVTSSWEVINGELGENLSLDDADYSKAAQEELWTYFSATIPSTSVIPYVDGFRIESDGVGGTLASVNPSNETSLRKWTVNMDPSDAYLSSSDLRLRNALDFYQTIIHEYGHILTLNDSQLNISDVLFDIENRNYSSETFELEEGVSKGSSYLNLYVEEFWSEDLLRSSDQNELIENETEKDGEVFDFYQDHEDKFVNDYAATNPIEDLAETWAYYVLLDRPEDLTEMRFEKINFFYGFSELVALREEIRSNLPQEAFALEL